MRKDNENMCKLREPYSLENPIDLGRRYRIYTLYYSSKEI